MLLTKIVAVALDDDELDITMFVITVVVPAGVVYRFVLNVEANVRARTFVTVAISYYLSFRGRP